jgi:hypothetical protein
MKPTYTEETTFRGTEIIRAVYENGVEVVIPKDLANSDYQAYLNKDKAEQSTPILPA